MKYGQDAKTVLALRGEVYNDGTNLRRYLTKTQDFLSAVKIG